MFCGLPDDVLLELSVIWKRGESLCWDSAKLNYGAEDEAFREFKRQLATGMFNRMVADGVEPDDAVRIIERVSSGDMLAHIGPAGHA